MGFDVVSGIIVLRSFLLSYSDPSYPSPMAIDIAGRLIGPDHPPFVIAEMSGNHNQSLDRALEIVEAAASSGLMPLSCRHIPQTV